MTRPKGLLCAAIACAIGCATPDVDELRVSCEGKCDGLGDTIQSLWRNPRALDLGDLVSVGAGFATDELNGALRLADWGSIRIAAPTLYATHDRADSDLTLHDVDALVSGLAARFGEKELTTEVNAVREATLAQSSGAVFGESSFRLAVSLARSWSLSTGGLGAASAAVGFDGGAALEARVVGLYGGEPSATLQAPLSALADARGFVLPRSASDLRAMKPGESFALRGSGRLGVNLGVGVPILVAQPTSWLTYNLVLSAGLRTLLEGDLDVQLVRLDGSQVVVDVGMDAARVLSAQIALEDAWGVQGLLKARVEIGPVSVDLARLVENALRKQLDAKLNLIRARLSGSTVSERVSVARLRFDLDADAGSVAPGVRDQAIAQALRGDVRLAQALAARGEPGVRADFDLLRSGVSATSYAGIDIFGMSFFHDFETAEGQIVVQTPGGAAALLFDSLHRQSGWFFSSHGYTRVGLGGLFFGAQRAAPRGEANLFLQVEEGDDFMERDKLLDHLDAVILGVGGPGALAAVEGPGNQLQAYVGATCRPTGPFDPCLVGILQDPTVVLLRQQGEAALAAVIDRVDPPLRDLVAQAGRLRLAAQATLEYPATFVGPPTSVVSDFRIDDAALGALLQGSGADFSAAMVAVLGAVDVDRGAPGDLAAQRAAIAGEHAGALAEVAAIFDAHAQTYRRLEGAEEASIDTLGQMGPRALEIRFPIDEHNRPVYEDAAARSLGQARGQEAMALYDDLRQVAKSLPNHAEATVGYALLRMVPAPSVDLRLDVKMNLSDSFSQSLESYRAAGYHNLDLYGRGSSSNLIGGGVFSIDALLRVDQH